MKKYIITEDQFDDIRALIPSKWSPEARRLFESLKPIEPLSLEVIKEFKAKYPSEDLCHWSYNMGAADAERHFIGDAK